MSGNEKKQLPLGWREASLGELITVLRGVSYKKQDATTEPAAGKIPILRASNIDARLNFIDLVYVPQEYVSEVQLLNVGDIVIAASSGSRHVVGKAASLTVPWVGSFGAFCYGLRPHLQATASYLSLFLQTSIYRDYVSALSAGININNLRREHIEGVPLPIAPLNEQRRIVAKIEELFSELDKGVESLKTAREQLKVYRQAVLKHAFEGKLTAQWREENKDKLEKPEQLLARIKQEREARYERQLQEWTGDVKTWEAKGKLGKKPTKPKKLKALFSDEVPTLPEGWSWFSLSAIAGNIQIGPFGSLLHKADYLVGGTPLVNPSHIRFQRIEPDRTLTVSAGKLHQLGKYVMHENDIVIGRRGEMGRCAVVTAAEAGWLCGTGSLFVRLLSSMNPHFYSWVLGSQRVKDFLAASSIGTTMQNLNEGILHRVPVPVCSRHEQDEVFREIERQYSTLDHIEAIIDSEITKSATLRQSILKRAFAGQLVAQDPSDEPASVLLDRIKANKEQISKKAAATKKTREKRTPA